MSLWPSIIDAEIVAKRARHAVALTAEHARMVAERQAREAQRVVADREANVTVRRIAERVR